MASVVVTGPPGSGGSLVASMIHAASTRSDQPVTRVDLRDAESWARLGDSAGTLLLRHPDRLLEVE